MATTTELEARIKELEARLREKAILLADAHRDTCPCCELLGRELARILALAQDLGPVGERAHLAEDAVADHATHLRQKPGLDPIEPTADRLGGLLGPRQRAR